MGPRKKSKKGSDDDDDGLLDDEPFDEEDILPPKAPVVAPLPVAPVLIEELWAQCERCDKWRLLPPGTTPPPDNVPW